MADTPTDPVEAAVERIGRACLSSRSGEMETAIRTELLAAEARGRKAGMAEAAKIAAYAPLIRAAAERKP